MVQECLDVIFLGHKAGWDLMNVWMVSLLLSSELAVIFSVLCVRTAVANDWTNLQAGFPPNFPINKGGYHTPTPELNDEHQHLSKTAAMHVSL